MNSNVLTYRPRIDGLRCLAISFVLLEHFGGLLAGHIAGGYYGVDLFFVISGYLITSILLRDTGHTFAQSYRGFIGRRALRIFPAYYLLLFLLVVINYAPSRELFPWLATYTFNYPAARVKETGVDNGLFYLWSLSVEEQFYLFWPPIVIALRKRKQLLLAVTAAIVVFGYAQTLFRIVPTLSIYNYTGVLNRMGSLGLGAFGAIYAAWRPLRSAMLESVVLESIVLAVLAAALVIPFHYRYAVMAPCSLFLVLKAAYGSFQVKPLERLLTNPRVVWIGTISYGIYLFHVPAAVLFGRYIFDLFWNAIPFDHFGAFEKLRWHSWVVKLPLYSALSITLAAASFRWFESPILRYKDRWFRYSSAPVSSAESILPDEASALP